MNTQYLKIEKFTKDHIEEYLKFCFDAYVAGTNYIFDTPEARQ